MKPTVKVAGVILRLQLRDEFSFLSQESIPVEAQEERVLFDLRGSACSSSQVLKPCHFNKQALLIQISNFVFKLLLFLFHFKVMDLQMFLNIFRC